MTHDLVGDVVVEQLGVEVGGLVNVEATVDLDLEVVPVRVVEQPLGLVQLDRLALAAAEEDVRALSITDWGLEINTNVNSGLFS